MQSKSSVAIILLAIVLACGLASATFQRTAPYYQSYPSYGYYGPSYGYNYGPGYRGYSSVQPAYSQYQPYYQPYYSNGYYGPSYYPYASRA